MNNFKDFLEAYSLSKICEIVFEYTLKCSQLISSSDNKKILLTTRNVRLDSGRYATKYYSNVTTEVTLMGIEKDGAYIAGEAPTVSSGKLAVAASDT